MLLALLGDIRNKKVLDAGCGNGRDAERLWKEFGNTFTYRGIDFSSKMIFEVSKKFANKNAANISFRKADVLNLPFRTELFVIVFCSEVLEHVPNWKKALREFYRVLTPGGRLIVSTPNWLSLYGLTKTLLDMKYGSHHPHDKWKTSWILFRALRSSGFSENEIYGICYLPGVISYKIPRRLYRMRTFFAKIEQKFSRNKLLKHVGYMIMICSTKIT